jgi:hypothetical protein
VNVENPYAFSFIMNDELFLLKKDKVAAAAVVPSPPSPTPVKTPPQGFNFMGANKKNFLIVTHYPETEFIDQAHLAALESVLTRLGLSIDDTAIINRAKYTDASHRELSDFFKPHKLLLLGEEALPAGMEPPTLNQPKKINGCPVLYSFSFGEMMDNNAYKKAFWEQMKQL